MIRPLSMSRPRLLLLFFGFLLLYAAGDWALPLIDRDEPRFAEASREMLDRGDYVVPYSNNVYRFDKPPLIYWLEAGAYKLFGENEFAARLPSGLCGALAVVIIALWGSQLYDPRTGWRAALIFGLCVQTMIHAHAAVADMAMVAASTGAAWAGWNWLIATGRRQSAAWWFAFWALLALGFLAKGPIAWIPIGMAGWTAAKMERGKRPCALQWITGAVLMLALVGIWGIPAMIRTHGQFAVVGLGRHVVMRSISPLQGHGAKTGLSYFFTLPYYLLTVWPSFFPWSLWLPPAVAGLWGRRREWAPRESYLVAGVVLVFGIFTLSWTKLPHYTLPAFPFMALLLAASWQRAPYPLFRWVAAGMVAGGIVVTLAILPLVRPLFVSQVLYDAAAPYLTPQTQLAAVGYEEPSLVWLFRKKIDGFETSMPWRDLNHWMQRPGPRVCVVPADQLGRAFHRLDPAWKVIRASGYDVANAHRTDLVAVIRE